MSPRPSQQPYLCAVARGWSLATWDKTPVQNATSRIDQKNAWLALITSPFYRELFTFANNVKQDIHNAAVEQGLIFEDLDIAEQ